MRLWRVLGYLALLACVAGCAARNKAYPGPVLAQEKLGLVVPARQAGYSTKYVAILEINGADEIENSPAVGSPEGWASAIPNRTSTNSTGTAREVLVRSIYSPKAPNFRSESTDRWTPQRAPPELLIG